MTRRAPRRVLLALVGVALAFACRERASDGARRTAKPAATAMSGTAAPARDSRSAVRAPREKGGEHAIKETSQTGAKPELLDVIVQIRSNGAPLPAGVRQDEDFDARVSSLREELGSDARSVRRIGGTDRLSLEVTPEGLAKLKRSPQVASVRPERVGRPQLDHSCEVIRAQAAAERGATGEGYAVAVLDTGVQRSHPFLEGRVLREACFAKSCPSGEVGEADGAAEPLSTHGTHVAGIIAGVETTLTTAAKTTRSLHGVAPRTKIVAVQVFEQTDKSSLCAGHPPCLVTFESSQSNALAYVSSKATQLKIVAVNMSLADVDPALYQAPCDDSALDTRVAEIDALTSKGVAVVIAAGNSFTGAGVRRPACIGSAISVAATDNDDGIPSALCNGNLTDFMAPGVLVTSSVVAAANGPVASFNAVTGTSVAAPHVAGAIAALHALPSKPALPAILQALSETGVKLLDERNGVNVVKPRINLGAAAKSLSPDVAGVGQAPPPPRSFRFWWLLALLAGLLLLVALVVVSKRGRRRSATKPEESDAIA